MANEKEKEPVEQKQEDEHEQEQLHAMRHKDFYSELKIDLHQVYMFVLVGAFIGSICIFNMMQIGVCWTESPIVLSPLDSVINATFAGANATTVNTNATDTRPLSMSMAMRIQKSPVCLAYSLILVLSGILFIGVVIMSVMLGVHLGQANTLRPRQVTIIFTGVYVSLWIAILLLMVMLIIRIASIFWWAPHERNIMVATMVVLLACFVVVSVVANHKLGRMTKRIDTDLRRRLRYPHVRYTMETG